MALRPLVRAMTILPTHSCTATIKGSTGPMEERRADVDAAVLQRWCLSHGASASEGNRICQIAQNNNFKRVCTEAISAYYLRHACPSVRAYHCGIQGTEFRKIWYQGRFNTMSRKSKSGYNRALCMKILRAVSCCRWYKIVIQALSSSECMRLLGKPRRYL
jgi:hypothetical protein